MSLYLVAPAGLSKRSAAFWSAAHCTFYCTFWVWILFSLSHISSSNVLQYRQLWNWRLIEKVDLNINDMDADHVDAEVQLLRDKINELGSLQVLIMISVRACSMLSVASAGRRPDGYRLRYALWANSGYFWGAVSCMTVWMLGIICRILFPCCCISHRLSMGLCGQQRKEKPWTLQVCRGDQ